MKFVCSTLSAICPPVPHPFAVVTPITTVSTTPTATAFTAIVVPAEVTAPRYSKKKGCILSSLLFKESTR